MLLGSLTLGQDRTPGRPELLLSARMSDCSAPRGLCLLPTRPPLFYMALDTWQKKKEICKLAEATRYAKMVFFNVGVGCFSCSNP